MSGFIYLIGGGEIKDGDTQLIDEDLMSKAPKGSNFVFFGFASQDSTDYADAIRSVYGKKYDIVVPTVEKDREFAVDAIKSADIIYLGGGNTDELMRIFAQWDLVKYLHSAIDRGVHIAGMSAGAQALSTKYVHEDDNSFEVREGWGFVPYSILVHANPSSFKEAKLLLPDQDKNYPLIAIGEGAALRVNNPETTKIGFGNIWNTSEQIN